MSGEERPESAMEKEAIMEITLKSARINKGYTQKRAAALIGISKNTLSNYERGKTYPSIPIIKRIEDVYGMSYTNIIFCPRD